MRFLRGLGAPARIGLTLLVAGALLLIALRLPDGGPEPIPGDRRDWFQSACDLPLELLERIERGHLDGPAPDVQIVPREPHLFGARGSFKLTGHTGPWDYLARVPLLLYGPGFIAPNGLIASDPPATLADYAPTIGELIGHRFDPPGGGRVITEALLPAGERNGVPRVVVTIVWDGGGWNVLNLWPDAWPTLARLMEEGTTIRNATIGSSPSVTPSIHANIGTGTFPNRHGITQIPIRIDGKIIDSWQDTSPQYLLTPTLADEFDVATDNESLVGYFGYRAWHLGLMGHGAYSAGGDKDMAVLVDEEGGFFTNPDYYSMPAYANDIGGLERFLTAADLEDGTLDQTWGDRPVLGDPKARQWTPAWSMYQRKIIRRLLDQEGFGKDEIPDLFFTNYKHIDQVGHYFNRVSPQMEVTLRHSDDALADLVEYLNRAVGENRWVVGLTADHGQGYKAQEKDAWAISDKELVEDVAAHFDVPGELFVQAMRPSGFWLDYDAMAEFGITDEEVARYVLHYELGQNVQDGKKMPGFYEGRENERLFATAFLSDDLDEIMECARKRQS